MLKALIKSITFWAPWSDVTQQKWSWQSSGQTALATQSLIKRYFRFCTSQESMHWAYSSKTDNANEQAVTYERSFLNRGGCLASNGSQEMRYVGRGRYCKFISKYSTSIRMERKDWGKPRKSLVRTTGASTEIRIKMLPSTNQTFPLNKSAHCVDLVT
jgi:hypothetical protein